MVYGLVGRSGSGKSTAAKVFAERGFFVVDCDKVAAQVLLTDESVKNALAEAFGSDVLVGGEVDKKLIAERAFADRESLGLLNSITHPPILAKLAAICAEHEKTLLDAPTLFESGADKLCDVIIAVTAPEEACETRLLARDGASPEAIRRRLAMQKSEDFLRERADVVLENNGGEAEFRRLVENVAQTL